MNKLEELSKEISYALRHAPWEYELEMDEEGWTPIEQLLDALHRVEKWKNICEADLGKMIEESEKKRQFIQSIMESGLLPQSRQYVHLSQDVETAENVGKRHDSMPCILIIDAKRAWNEGIKFYMGNEKVWLADMISSKYIIVK